MENNKLRTIDKYIESFEPEVQVVLKQIREAIKKAAPEAEEAIKYQMPTFVQNGNLIHFAAFKNHYGLYPTPSGIKQFAGELAEYQTSKGAIQFSKTKPIPYKLIDKITKFRVSQLSSKDD